MSDVKMWGKEPFWGLGFEFDPQWLLNPSKVFPLEGRSAA